METLRLLETLLLLVFLFVFIRFARASRQQGDSVLKLVDGALWSLTFLALVDRVLPFVLEGLRLSA